MAKKKEKEEAIRLRVEHRLSLEVISKQLGVSQSSCSLWLRGYPLSEQEKSTRKPPSTKGIARKIRGDRSKFSNVVDGQELTKSRKGRIAESAILFRLALHGLTPYGSPFDGDKTDWVVENAQGRTMKVQVRWAREARKGLPFISLRISDGRHNTRRDTENEFDFIVAYDLYTDTAYVFNQEDVRNNTALIAVSEERAEKWQQLLDF
jgi:transposase-like protein